MEERIRNRVKRQMEKAEREYYLNLEEQLKAVVTELEAHPGSILSSRKSIP
jgi:ATP-dependent Lon protease